MQVLVGMDRKNHRIRLALVETTTERQARKLASEYLRPMNQGLETIGSAVNFKAFVDGTYRNLEYVDWARTTISRTNGVLDNYLIPTFGELSLRDRSLERLQAYFGSLASAPLSHESRDKIRDVLSSVLNSAIKYKVIMANPMEYVKVPRDRRRKKRNKPYVPPEKFDELLAKIPESYASMAFVAIYTGLRVSELVGLKWDDIHEDSITIDERFCRGDWDVPKSEASNATIGITTSLPDS